MPSGAESLSADQLNELYLNCLSNKDIASVLGILDLLISKGETKGEKVVWITVLY